jgi:hypothetical protein
VAITIPPGVVASARDGAYELAREAAEAIVELLDGGKARRDREAYHKALARLTRAYALLDVIGWQPPQEGRREVAVGAEHAITLYDALQEGLVGEEHGVEAKRESTQMAERTVEAVRAFMDTFGEPAHE